MKKRIFLSGPITGLINNNKGAFMDAATVLRAMGYIVFVPYEIMQGIDTEGWEHMDYCRVCAAMLINEADVMLQLQGWQKSTGCAIEKATCELFKIPYLPIEQFLDEREQAK